MVGKRTRHFSAPNCSRVQPDVFGAGLAHASQDRLGDDVARREVGQFVLAVHEADTGVVHQNAPSPRTASLTSGCCPRARGPSQVTVGWNWTNSRSRSTAPARRAAATPSPVDTLGFVVDA